MMLNPISIGMLQLAKKTETKVKEKVEYRWRVGKELDSNRQFIIGLYIERTIACNNSSNFQAFR